jgi:hypothetical protein
MAKKRKFDIRKKPHLRWDKKWGGWLVYYNPSPKYAKYCEGPFGGVCVDMTLPFNLKNYLDKNCDPRIKYGTDKV